ncbi:MAG TPA: nuclear transport factor 2 family protein [Egibacteraceae bacterium]|nr:nuclear transport factor 2 family protein [Egibacteraceae bacterium]
MTPAPGSLEAANDAFYAAFESLDLDRMDVLWDHGEDVFCVHPGSELIAGWGPVRRSWAAIFSATDYLQFIVTDVRARVETGVLSCVENILTPGPDEGGRGFGAGRAVATNVFSWREGHWRMTAHHASPILRPAAS